MEPADVSILKKIRLKTSRKLNTLFVGEYHSAFKGFGLSFDSVREYQFGDDIRNIEWNVSARMNHLYIKEYVEERELSIVLLVDISGSMNFGTSRSKGDMILEIVTLFLYLAQLNNDSISVLLFTDEVEKFIQPQKGRKYVLKVLDEIIKCSPEGRKTNISKALDFTLRVMKKRSVILLISDFIDDSGQDYLTKLRHMKRKHDIIPVHVSDPFEKEMKLFGLAEFIDLETGEVFLSDTIPQRTPAPALTEFDSIMLKTNESIEKPILKFFEKRNRSRILR